MALVVVNGDDDVELAAAGPREQRVGGQGPVDVEALLPRGGDGGEDRLLLLVAEEPFLPGVRVEAAHGDPRTRDPEEAHGLLRERDDAPDTLAGHQVGDS